MLRNPKTLMLSRIVSSEEGILHLTKNLEQFFFKHVETILKQVFSQNKSSDYKSHSVYNFSFSGKFS